MDSFLCELYLSYRIQLDRQIGFPLTRLSSEDGPHPWEILDPTQTPLEVESAFAIGNISDISLISMHFLETLLGIQESV